MKKALFAALIFICAVAFVTWITGTPAADARSSFYTDQGCQSCHGATSTCNGCHSHGTHATKSKNDINIAGATNKNSYAAGETMSVTISGGYKTGWVRAILYNQSMQEVARSTGQAFLVTLTASAPATAGTYKYSVSWYGNKYDAAGALFQTACSGTQTTNCWKASTTNPNHGEEIVETNAFDVIISNVENNAALCSDGIDNDGDAKID